MKEKCPPGAGRHKAGQIKMRMIINPGGILKNLEGDGKMVTLQHDLISNHRYLYAK